MSLNIPTFYIARFFKIYPIWEFRFEKIPPGNPAEQHLSGSKSSVLFAPHSLYVDRRVVVVVLGMSIIIIRNDLHRHRVCLQALPFSHSKSG
jgi:hypothetical protein